MLTPRRCALWLALVFLSSHLGFAQAATFSPEKLFARDHLLKIEIQMTADDWRDVRTSHRRNDDINLSRLAEEAYEYRRADVLIDGVKVAQVGVRKKGFIGSVVSTRPSLKIKFDEYVKGQAFAGIGGLTLNNNNQDRALVQTFLAYDFFARAGVPAPRANFAHVIVNGEDLGVYTHVEAVNRDFVRRVFGSDQGMLYESYAGDFEKGRGTALGGGSSTSRFVEKSGGKDQDRGAIAALTEVLAVTEPVSLARIEALVDLDAFIRLWAAESLVGHWDGYAGNRNNFYVYVDPATKKMRFIPWGADSIFTDPGPFLTGITVKSFKARGILARRLWELPEIRDRYRRVMRELLAGAWDEKRLLADIADLQERLVPLSKLSPEAVRVATAEAEKFIRNRRAEVEAELTPPGPDWPAPTTAQSRTRAEMTVTGSFTAPWGKAAPADAFAAGTGEIQVEIEGKPKVEMASAGAYAITNSDSGMSAMRANYPAVVVTGRAGEDVWQVTLTIEPFAAESGKRVLPIDLYTVSARVSLTQGTEKPRGRGIGNIGELVLEEAVPKEGGVLRGRFLIKGREP